MVYKYLKFENRKCLAIRKVGKDIRNSIFAEFKTVLSDWKIYNRTEVRETNLEITLPNKSVFIFTGLDDPERVKSISDVSDIVCEEATELTLDDYTQLNLRLRSKKPYNQIHMMYNPVGKQNWVYSQWHDRELDPTTTMLLHTTYKDNRFLPADYIKTLEDMKQTNPTYYKIYVEGQFATLDKLIFNNWRIEEFNHIDILQQSKEVIAVFALDFGFTNDPTAFIAAIADKHNRKLYIYDEFQQKGLTNDLIAQKIKNMGYHKEIIMADSAEPKSIEELRKYGIERIKPAKKGKDSIINGIQYLQQFEIIVHPRCRYISEELSNYTWQKDKNGFYINKPIDNYNHSIDALRYAMTQVKKNNLHPVFVYGL